MFVYRRVTHFGAFLLALLLLVQGTIGYTAATPQSEWHGSGVLVSLRQDGRPAEGESVVLTARPEPIQSNPTGDQVFRIAGPTQGLETLDPALSRDLASAFLIRQVFRGLTRLDHDLQPVPELSDRIEISADGLEYTFHLRDGVTFHDGSPIEASDVVASLARALTPETADGEAALLGGPTFLSDIDGASEVISGQATELRGVQEIDDRTVRIRLSAPRATFLMKLAAAPASIVDADQVSGEPDWWRRPNGSGPFRVEEWLPNEQLTLSGFDGFFAGTPALERIDVVLGANALQSFNLYQAGEIDVDSVNINVLPRVMAPESGLEDELTVTPLFAVDYIAFRTDVEPMDDPMIRRAVQLGFPRAKVASVTYEDYVAPASGLIPDGMLGREWESDIVRYDLEAAREAIAQSRYGAPENVPPIRIYVAGGGVAESLRDVLRADLGLTVEVISIDWNEFVDGLSRRSYPAYELYWGADYPDPESLLWTLFGSESADNYVDYSNAAMDELLRQAAQEQDIERRSQLYAQAQQMLMDDLVVIPFYFDVSYTVAKPYVKGLQITPLGILRLETVWLER